MSVEHGFIPEHIVKPKQEQKETERMIVERYELKDKDGNIICHVEATFASGEDKSMKWVRGREGVVGRWLKSMVFERDGKKVDLLNLIDLSNPIGIFVSKKDSDKRYYYNNQHKVVFVPPLTHPMGVAIALHELGHAKQHEISFFHEIATIGSKTPQIFIFSTDYRERFLQLAAVYPELKAELPSEETLKKMDEIREEAAPIMARKKRLQEVEDQIERLIWDQTGTRIHRSDFEDRETGDIDRTAYTKMRDKLLDTFKKIPTSILALVHESESLRAVVEQEKREYHRLSAEFRVIARPLDQVLLAPIRVAERDATKRAFQWMQKVYDETGADILSAQAEESDSYRERNFGDKNSCKESTKRVVKDIEKFGGFSAKGALLRALGSYDAFEKIPVPSLKRLEQLEHEEEVQAAKKSSGV